MSVVGGRRREDFVKYSFDFDGTDEFFSGTTNYTSTDAQTKLTISAWINLDSASTTFSYLLAVPGGSRYSFGVRLQSLTSTNCWLYLNSGANNSRANTNLGVIKNTGWHHLMICLDLSLPNFQECQIFFDGVAKSMTGYFAQSSIPSSTGAMTIGYQATDANPNYLGGLVDELAIWSGSDLRENINEIYNNGAPNYLNNLPSVPPPTNWFRMGEESNLNGTQWTMTDVNGGYTVLSSNMDGNNRVEDTP